MPRVAGTLPSAALRASTSVRLPYAAMKFAALALVACTLAVGAAAGELPLNQPPCCRRRQVAGWAGVPAVVLPGCTWLESHHTAMVPKVEPTIAHVCASLRYRAAYGHHCSREPAPAAALPASSSVPKLSLFMPSSCISCAVHLATLMLSVLQARCRLCPGTLATPPHASPPTTAAAPPRSPRCRLTRCRNSSCTRSAKGVGCRVGGFLGQV